MRMFLRQTDYNFISNHLHAILLKGLLFGITAWRALSFNLSFKRKKKQTKTTIDNTLTASTRLTCADRQQCLELQEPQQQ